MTRLEFYQLCETYLVAPSIALENISIADALAHKDDERVIALMESEF